MSTFDKILVANRGEIACRVMRTARRLGIATVAVFSEADRNALHLQFADEVIGIGPAASRESYLAVDRIVEACLKVGASAVHPGYGFLAESADFCERLEREGITFIGPRAESIRTMGDKIAAKDSGAEGRCQRHPRVRPRPPRTRLPRAASPPRSATP